jgi:hypothetical protein
MMSLGSDARFRTPSLRSLNYLLQSRHLNRRYACAVCSRLSVTAAEPQPTQSIPLRPHHAAILGKLIPRCYPASERREA